MTGILTVDAADESVCLDLSTDDRWHVLALHKDTPVARIDIASPGEQMSGALLSAAVLRWADWAVARDELAQRLGARLGLPQPTDSPPPVRCSVVVCTRRHPDDLARLLDSLVLLDPAPAEVIVVDNDPGELDCRSIVLAAGFRYIREERRGLNNARNAGVREARGDLVAFIDDDCVASAGWLAALPAEFANPSVGAVTGPAFPYALDTPSRRRMERQASLARGLGRLEFDWTTFPVTGAGAIGVGANMIFRRAILLALGTEPFPPELDAGTAAESGGDTYMVAKLLARGNRVVYDPSTFVYHSHRADARALHSAFFGYGVGLGAALTRLLVEDRELSTPVTWMWLVSQYARTQQRRLAGRADRVETRLAWDFLRGGMLGPARWRRALREVDPGRLPTGALPTGPLEAGALPTGALPTGPLEAGPRQAGPPLMLHAPALAGVEPLPAAAGPARTPAGLHTTLDHPAVSVIVPTHERPEALAQCLDALARQDIGADSFEVIVVDDSSTGSARTDTPGTHAARVRVIRTGGRGAAEARNAGAAAAAAPVLLFLDDDVIALPDLVRRHLERHAGEPGDAIVVGAYPPRPAGWSLAAAAAALWWNDLFQAMGRVVTPTYVGTLTGNMSISKPAFERSGRFDPRFGRYRREDWEWGLRALKAGLSLRYEPTARGHHEYALSAPGRLRAAELEGHGDVLLLRDHPEGGSAVIPLVTQPPSPESARRRLERVLWRSPLVRAAVSTTLAALEWGRLRLLWVRLFNIAQSLSYEQGAHEAQTAPGARFEEPVLDLDLDGTGSIPAPPVAAPTLRVRVGGVEVARVRPALGLWTSNLAEQILSEVPWAAIEQAAASTGCFPGRDETHEHAPHTRVIFGPAHTENDLVHRAQLTASGAQVSVAAGPAAQHWSRVVELAREGESELIALTMPGTRPDPRWLDQALVAFGGSRVGVVVGQALADHAPAAPLVLRSASAADEDLQHGAAINPRYVVLRRELLPALVGASERYGLLTPVLALVEDALEGGWVVGYRDVHGLRGGGVRDFDGGRARAALRVRRSRTPFASARTELRHSTVLTAWHFIRRRDRRMAGEVYAGALTGLCASLWSSRRPRFTLRGRPSFTLRGEAPGEGVEASDSVVVDRSAD